jgi:hypothetical protein
MAMLETLVGPPCDHQRTWCASAHRAGMVQLGMTQVRSRAMRAWRWVGVAVRTLYPNSRRSVVGFFRSCFTVASHR